MQIFYTRVHSIVERRVTSFESQTKEWRASATLHLSGTVPLVDHPTQTLTPPELKFPTDQTELITVEVHELLGKGTISLVQGDAGVSYPKHSLSPKKTEDTVW